MTSLMYDPAIAPLLRSLKNLDSITTKAEQFQKADDHIGPETLTQARLFPNMGSFVFQVRIATDTAKGAAARLGSKPLPSWADTEVSFADVHARIDKAIDYLAEFHPADFEGAELRGIELNLGADTMTFSGAEYAANFVLPNFYFHVTTAYNILRHNGVGIGKRDYLGSF